MELSELEDFVDRATGFIIFSFSISSKIMSNKTRYKFKNILAKYKFKRAHKGIYVAPVVGDLTKEEIYDDIESTEFEHDTSYILFHLTPGEFKACRLRHFKGNHHEDYSR